MSIDRLTALATLTRIEADNAPEGEIKKALMSAARTIAAAIRMTEDVAGGACPSCGAPAGATTPGCEAAAGCGRRPVAPEWRALVERPRLEPAPPVQLHAAAATPGQKAAATRASRKAVA